jgi:tetratricopeptide (TPR) repeat protein
LALLVVAITVAVYWPARKFGFIFDDKIEIPSYPGIFKAGQWPHFFLQQQSDVYRPIKYVLFRAVIAAWGFIPFPFHLTNVLLHAAQGIAVLLLCRALRHSLVGSFIGAVWFAVHPVNIEGVAWVSAVSGILAAIGVTLAFTCYVYWERSGRVLWLVLFSISLLFGYFSKEHAVAVILVLFGWVRIQRSGVERELSTSWRRGLVAAGLSALLAIPYLVLRALLLPSFSQGTAREHGIAGLIATLPDILWRYFSISIIPRGLTLEPYLNYARPINFSYFAEVLVVLVAVALPFLRRIPMVYRVASLWYGVFLLPVLGIIPINAPVADRYLYLSLVGGSLALSHGMDQLFARGTAPRFASIGILVAWATMFVWMDWRYLPVWQNDDTLWTQVVRQNPSSYRAWNNLAVEANARADFRKAVEFADRSLQIKPDYPDAQIAQGFAHAGLGDLKQAEQLYLSALDIRPTDVNALYLLADLRERQNRDSDALSLYLRAIEIRPWYSDARIAAGLLYAKSGQRELARAQWIRALQDEPENQLAMHNLHLLESEIHEVKQANPMSGYVDGTSSGTAMLTGSLTTGQ